jgi:hypothetical protein
LEPLRPQQSPIGSSKQSSRTAPRSTSRPGTCVRAPLSLITAHNCSVASRSDRAQTKKRPPLPQRYGTNGKPVASDPTPPPPIPTARARCDLTAPELPIRARPQRTERAHRTTPDNREAARPIGTFVCASDQSAASTSQASDVLTVTPSGASGVGGCLSGTVRWRLDRWPLAHRVGSVRRFQRAGGRTSRSGRVRDERDS